MYYYEDRWYEDGHPAMCRIYMHLTAPYMFVVSTGGREYSTTQVRNAETGRKI